MVKRRRLLIAGMTVLAAVLAGTGIYRNSPYYTAGNGQGSATGRSATESLCQSYGESSVEALADWSLIPEEEDALIWLVENSVFSLDEDGIQRRLEEQMLNMELLAEADGCSLEEYLTGICGYESSASYEQEYRESCISFLKTRLAIYEVAQAEQITVSVQEYREKLADYAERYGYEEDAERFESECERDSIAMEMLYDKTVEYLYGST